MIPEDTQNPGRCMEPLQLAGQIIMENGGETFRAEETICRMGEGLGLHEVESFAVPSGLFISYRAEGEQLETGIKRVHRQSTNLTRVDEVNRVSRQVSAGKMSAQDALTRLRDIARMKGPMAYHGERLRLSLGDGETSHPTLADRRFDQELPVVSELERHVESGGLRHPETVGCRSKLL